MRAAARPPATGRYSAVPPSQELQRPAAALAADDSTGKPRGKECSAGSYSPPFPLPSLPRHSALPDSWKQHLLVQATARKVRRSPRHEHFPAATPHVSPRALLSGSCQASHGSSADREAGRQCAPCVSGGVTPVACILPGPQSAFMTMSNSPPACYTKNVCPLSPQRRALGGATLWPDTPPDIPALLAARMAAPAASPAPPVVGLVDYSDSSDSDAVDEAATEGGGPTVPPPQPQEKSDALAWAWAQLPPAADLSRRARAMLL